MAEFWYEKCPKCHTEDEQPINQLFEMVNAHNRLKKKAHQDQEKADKDIKRLNCICHDLQKTVHELAGRLSKLEQNGQVNTGGFSFGQK